MTTIIIGGMDEIAISEFKAACLRLIDQVKNTGVSILITKNGKPTAVVSPVPPKDVTHVKAGALAGRGETVGDIISPAAEEDWEALK